jgi:hypothetical protein
MIHTLKRIFVFIIVMPMILWNINCFGQDTLKPAVHTHTGIVLINEDAEQINGLGLGIWDQPEVNREQRINGIQLELVGSGWVTPFLFLDDGGYISKSRDHLRTNGLLIGTTLLAGKINGVGISPFVITHHDLNGLIIAPVTVTLYTANGIVIGILNFSTSMKGVHVGIYNNTEQMNGLEAGISNQCRDRSTGLQVGLVNRSREHKGVQIGLVNIIGKRITPLVNWNFRPFRNAS